MATPAARHPCRRCSTSSTLPQSYRGADGRGRQPPPRGRPHASRRSFPGRASQPHRVAPTCSMSDAERTVNRVARRPSRRDARGTSADEAILHPRRGGAVPTPTLSRAARCWWSRTVCWSAQTSWACATELHRGAQAWPPASAWSFLDRPGSWRGQGGRRGGEREAVIEPRASGAPMRWVATLHALGTSPAGQARRARGDHGPSGSGKSTLLNLIGMTGQTPVPTSSTGAK